MLLTNMEITSLIFEETCREGPESQMTVIKVLIKLINNPPNRTIPSMEGPNPNPNTNTTYSAVWMRQ